MDNLFSGLEELGLSNLSNINVYDDKDKKDAKESQEKPQVTVSEEEFIFDKTYICPVCDSEFKSKSVKTGKIKLLSLDSDLRPRYQYVDPLKYDAVLCPKCGYASLTRFFKNITPTQADWIKKNISATFKPLPEKGHVYSYDDAIVRHKMALVNSIVKKAKTSERAYICLKTAWIIRGKAETLPSDTPNYREVMEQLAQEEKKFIANAYEGFSEAYMNEAFPMCGMDEHTIALLIAELARKTGKLDEASRWISRILISKEASERIKDKAREIKEMIKEGRN